MRNYVVAACFIVGFVATAASAQSIGGGVKGGVQFADVPKYAQEFEDWGVAKDVGMRVGFIGGGYARFDFGRNVAFQPEVLYSQKGFKGTEVATGHDLALRLDYIEIPLLLRVQSGKAGPYLMGGPSFGWNVRAKGYDSGSRQNETDIKDSIATSEVALVLAGGLTFSSGILIEGRYSEGMSEILKDWSGDHSHKNRAFAVLGGFAF